MSRSTCRPLCSRMAKTSAQAPSSTNDTTPAVRADARLEGRVERGESLAEVRLHPPPLLRPIGLIGKDDEQQFLEERRHHHGTLVGGAEDLAGEGEGPPCRLRLPEGRVGVAQAAVGVAARAAGLLRRQADDLLAERPRPREPPALPQREGQLAPPVLRVEWAIAGRVEGGQASAIRRGQRVEQGNSPPPSWRSPAGGGRPGTGTCPGRSARRRPAPRRRSRRPGAPPPPGRRPRQPGR